MVPEVRRKQMSSVQTRDEMSRGCGHAADRKKGRYESQEGKLGKVNLRNKDVLVRDLFFKIPPLKDVNQILGLGQRHTK